MNKTNTGIFIMVGLLALALMIPRTADHFRSYDRTVSVKGLCEKEVKANKVIWPLVIKLGGNELAPLYDRVDEQNKQLRAFLHSAGISDDQISVSITSSDKYTSDYSNDRAARFIVKSVMTVCTTDVDAVLALQGRQDELFRKGIMLQSDWDCRTVFDFTALNDIKPEMIEQATKSARQAAEKFAQDSDSRLGKIKNATQGTFTISDRDENTPYIKNVRVVSSVTYYLSK